MKCEIKVVFILAGIVEGFLTSINRGYGRRSDAAQGVRSLSSPFKAGEKTG